MAPGPAWPALRDLNPRPSESESGTLSAELRAVIFYGHTALLRKMPRVRQIADMTESNDYDV